METFSCKSRDLSHLKPEFLDAQVLADARDALSYYGGTLNIRRRTLNPEGTRAQVQVQRVRLVYEGGRLGPGNPGWWEGAMEGVKSEAPGVEVLLR
ncbi:hypothetical protein [Myxococcus sp. RHSTA-1-4]|uniref:hypothetical protein n=1 Tax=Myxococcus sp. RHSTA-1-4 TaxID=2874601 RepID=UPI00351D36B6